MSVFVDAARVAAPREAEAAETETLFGAFACQGVIPSRPVARRRIDEVNILI